jgi:hypothetical protein
MHVRIALGMAGGCGLLGVPPAAVTVAHALPRLTAQSPARPSPGAQGSGTPLPLRPASQCRRGTAVPQAETPRRSHWATRGSWDAIGTGGRGCRVR